MPDPIEKREEEVPEAQMQERQRVPEGVVERPEDFGDIGTKEHIQDITTAIPSQPTTQVTDDSGQPLTQSQATRQVVIQLPAEPKQLEELLKKTKPVEALRWLVVFSIRMLKKAAHFGWNIVRGGDTKS